MRGLLLFFIISVMLSISCSKGQKAPMTGRSVDNHLPAVAQSTNSKQLIYLLPVKDILFLTSETVIVFPSYFQNVADKENINKERVPLLTTDGGESWQNLTSTVSEYKSIYFNNLSQGWMVNDKSELWETVNGGKTWNFISKITDDKESLLLPKQFKFTDEQKGWVLGFSSLWHTEDGGKTWEERDFQSNLVNFYFYDDNTGWVCAGNYPTEEPNAIYRTNDGGKTWEEVKIPNTIRGSDDIHDLFFVDSQNGWLASNRGIYRTKDGGSTWEKQKLPEEAKVNALYIASGIVIDKLWFISEQEGWAAGIRFTEGNWAESESILLHTINGGDLWQKVDTKIAGRKFSNVFFEDAKNGWLVGEIVMGEVDKDETKIYRTNDGAKSWKLVLSLNSPFAESKIRK